MSLILVPRLEFWMSCNVRSASQLMDSFLEVTALGFRRHNNFVWWVYIKVETIILTFWVLSGYFCRPKYWDTWCPLCTWTEGQKYRDAAAKSWAFLHLKWANFYTRALIFAWPNFLYENSAANQFKKSQQSANNQFEKRGKFKIPAFFFKFFDIHTMLKIVKIVSFHK